MPNPAELIIQIFGEGITASLRELLEKKHLYQSIRIPTDGLDATIAKESAIARASRAASAPPPISDPSGNDNSFSGFLTDRLKPLLSRQWDFFAENNPPPGANPVSGMSLKPLALPTVRVSCGSSICKGTIQPHNSGFPSLRHEVNAYCIQERPFVIQVFSFPFQCQNCRDEPLVFLVRREDFKLTLVGRSQFPSVEIPQCLPDSLAKIYRNAVISSKTGFVLAGILYLRVAVEQHLRDSIEPTELAKLGTRPTGEQLGDSYAKTLPAEFPNNVPTLKKVYGDLSESIHLGKDDELAKGVFEKTRSAIEVHFDALALFRKINAARRS